MTTLRHILSLATLAGLATAAPAFAQDEPQVFNAFAVANANGTVVRSAEKQFVVAGTLTGPMFIETDEGPVDAGHVTCAASVNVDEATAKTSASGGCTFTANDGAQAWGEWQCAGYLLVGCRGKLTLKGGSDRFKGVSGEGTMIWRPSASEFKKQLDGSALQNASGIVIWRNFRIAKMQ